MVCIYLLFTVHITRKEDNLKWIRYERTFFQFTFSNFWHITFQRFSIEIESVRTVVENRETSEAHDVLITIFFMWEKEYSFRGTLEFVTWIAVFVFRTVTAQFNRIEPLTFRTRTRLWMPCDAYKELCTAIVIGYGGIVTLTTTNIVVACVVTEVVSHILLNVC